MMDHKSKVSNVQPGHTFPWGKVVGWLFLATVLIGSWLFALVSIAVAEITRGALVLFRPSNTYIVASTFLMLAGVALLSIQLVAVVNYLMHGDASTNH